ncbi:hypothetical protein HanPSC8_Chr02g0058351 [Helianthus annuus]|nr:hypothetical protein HanPSC8_Chr02g0058351 [Helianthus annuus]
MSKLLLIHEFIVGLCFNQVQLIKLARNIYSIQDSIRWIEGIIFEIIPISTSFALNHNMLVWSSTSLNFSLNTITLWWRFSQL